MVSFFKDFSKPVTSVLEDDFEEKNKVTASVQGPYGIKVKVEDEIGSPLSKKGGKLTLKYGHSSGFSVDKLALDGKGMKLETSLSNITPGLKLLYKGEPTCQTLGAEFQNKVIATDFSINTKTNESNFSAVVAKDQFTVGTALKLQNKNLNDYTVGLGYATGGIFGAFTFDKSNALGLNVSYKACPPAVVVASVSKKSDAFTAALGTSYQCNPTTTLKAVADNNLDMKVACIQQLEAKTSVAGSATFNAKDIKNFKYGIAVTMG